METNTTKPPGQHKLFKKLWYAIVFSALYIVSAPQYINAQGNTGGDTITIAIDTFDIWDTSIFPLSLTGDIIWRLEPECIHFPGRFVWDFKDFPQDSQFVAKVELDIIHFCEAPPLTPGIFFQMFVGDSIVVEDLPVHISPPGGPTPETLELINPTCSPVDSVDLCLCEPFLEQLVVYTCCKPIAPDSIIAVCLDTTLHDLSPLIHCTNGSFSGPGVENDHFNPMEAGVGEHLIQYCDTCDINSEICCVEFIIQVCEVVIEEMVCDTICFGEANGMAMVLASSDCDTLSYLWSNGEETATIDSLEPGVYIVTVTDGNGCQAIDSCEIIECPELILIEIVCDTICPDSTNGMASVIVEGGCEPLEYSWSEGNGSTGPTVEGLSEGWVVVTITDFNGCELIDSCEVIALDIEPPEAVCQDITVYVDADGIATIDPEDIDGGSTDNCAIEQFEIDINSFDCNDVNEEVEVKLTITDREGLKDSCIAKVLVLDTIPPEITCPGNTTLYYGPSCLAEVDFSPPTATDNCDTIFNFGYSINPGDIIFGLTGGPDTFTVAAVAADASQNVSDPCTFYLFVLDTTPPNILFCPQGTIEVFVDEDSCSTTNYYNLSFTDNCPVLIKTYNPPLGTPLEPSPIPYFVSVNLADGAGNSDECSYGVLVSDTIDPQILCPPPIVTYTPSTACVAWVNLQVDTLDNCGVFEVINSYNNNGVDASDYYPTGQTIVYFNVEDVNGNTNECSTPVTVWDTFPPTINCPPDTIVQIPSGQSEVYVQLDSAEAWHNCGIALLVNDFNQGGPDASDTFPAGITTIQFIAVKNFVFNNPPPYSDTCETIITVVACPALDLDLTCSPISAPGADDGSAVANVIGGCPDISFFWNTGDTTSSISGLSPGMYSVTVTDGLGTTAVDSCEVIELVFPPVTISGHVSTENGTDINEASMHVTDIAGNPMLTDTTDIDGEYEFSLPWGSTLTVSPEKDNNHLDGVTTISLIIIQRHILLIDTLNSPYKMIAADINKDGVISTSDLVEMQSVILGILPNFLNNTSYRFTPEDYVFANPSNPLLENWPEEKTYVNITQDSLNEDWVAIKIGDVIGATTGMRYISGEVDFLLEAVKNEDGTTDIVMGPAYDFYLSGYQLELELDPAQLSLLEIDFDRSSLPGITHNNFHFDKENAVLRTNWWNQQDISLQAENEFFRLRVKEGLDKVDLSSAIKLNLRGSLWESEAYAGNGTQWLRPNLLWKEKYTTAEYKLYQNRPNPFTGETIISFLLPKPMDAVLEVSDVDGRVVKRLEIPAREGLNEFSLETGELSEGIYFYRVMTDQWSATKKMILMR
ncbi:MAG: HYR domain-containing protein [Saprospirales bacterium]|nr:MAG: HYR domain-containing protein [Saprospirales bacterium]